MSYAPRHPICDVCGEPKRQTNNWFQSRVNLGRIVVEGFTAEGKRVAHLCGEACVIKFISARLAGLHGQPASAAEDEPIDFPLIQSP